MKTLIYKNKNDTVRLYKRTSGRAHHFIVEIAGYVMAPFNWADALAKYNAHKTRWSH